MSYLQEIKSLKDKFESYEDIMKKQLSFPDVEKEIDKLKQKIRRVNEIVTNSEINVSWEEVEMLYSEIVMIINDMNIEKVLNMKDYVTTHRKIEYHNKFLNEKIQKTISIKNELKALNKELYDEYIFDLQDKLKGIDIKEDDIKELALIKVMNDKKSVKNTKNFTDKELDAKATKEIGIFMKMEDYLNSVYEWYKRNISMWYKSLDLLKSMMMRKFRIEKEWKNI